MNWMLFVAIIGLSITIVGGLSGVIYKRLVSETNARLDKMEVAITALKEQVTIINERVALLYDCFRKERGL